MYNTEARPSYAHMLVLLVQGIFTGLKFPLAQFATMDVASHQLYPIVFDAVMRLEIMSFKVILLTSDGSSPNRKVYRLMKNPADPTNSGYKSPNLFTNENRSLYVLYCRCSSSVEDDPELLV